MSEIKKGDSVAVVLAGDVNGSYKGIALQDVKNPFDSYIFLRPEQGGIMRVSGWAASEIVVNEVLL